MLTCQWEIGIEKPYTGLLKLDKLSPFSNYSKLDSVLTLEIVMGVLPFILQLFLATEVQYKAFWTKGQTSMPFVMKTVLP